jgi:hypothetical protein
VVSSLELEQVTATHSLKRTSSLEKRTQKTSAQPKRSMRTSSLLSHQNSAEKSWTNDDQLNYAASPTRTPQRSPGRTTISSTTTLRRHQSHQTTNRKQTAENSRQHDGTILPTRLPKPSFTSGKLTELSDLRNRASNGNTLTQANFVARETDTEDTAALVTYSVAVVKQERDVDKAVKMTKWLRIGLEKQSNQR